eukprot:c5768_g1_i1.p1 GENE.c5768_g1_i1~~c5768_g1_i1.p1  ORF type:complete len:198 (-),score=31.20 c5768_g1_i1:610-1203(-)
MAVWHHCCEGGGATTNAAMIPSTSTGSIFTKLPRPNLRCVPNKNAFKRPWVNEFQPSQALSVLFGPSVTIHLPSLDTATEFTHAPFSATTKLLTKLNPFFASHSRIVPSPETDAIHRPFREIATSFTSNAWPVSEWVRERECVSQTLMGPMETEIRNVSFGESAMARMGRWSWDRMVCCSAPRCVSQILIVASAEAE